MGKIFKSSVHRQLAKAGLKFNEHFLLYLFLENWMAMDWWAG